MFIIVVRWCCDERGSVVKDGQRTRRTRWHASTPPKSHHPKILTIISSGRAPNRDGLGEFNTGYVVGRDVIEQERGSLRCESGEAI